MRILTKNNLIVGVVVVIIAAAVLYAARGSRSATNEFYTLAAERGPLSKVVNATGVVQTVVTVTVGSQVSGKVLELYADYNSIVKNGQLLAKVDPRDFEAQLKDAEATVAAARAHVLGAEADLKTANANLIAGKANLEAAKVAKDTNLLLFQRADEMLKKGVESKNDFDNAKLNSDSAQAKYDQAAASVEQNEAQCASSAAALEAAKATLDQLIADLDRAKLNLDYTNIYSPVDGVVIARSVDVGQTIAAAMSAPVLFSIANDLTQMQVNASVDEADIGNVSSAEDVKFSVDAYPNDVFHAKVAEVRLNPQSVQNVVTYSVILSIDNKDMKLRPGMTATITFTVDQRDNVLKIPNAALRYVPPGQSRPDLSKQAAALTQAPPSSTKDDLSGEKLIPLAPGQKWDPADKIKFAAMKKPAPHPGVVWILDEQHKPVVRNVVLGITDGGTTEVVSGELKPGDLVIVGDATTMGTGQRGLFGQPTGGNAQGGQNGGGQRQ